MRLDIQEVTLLRNLAREQNLNIKIKIYGNIKIYSGIFEQDDNKYVTISFNGNEIFRNFGFLDIYLKNKYRMDNKVIESFSWLNYIFLNYIEVEFDDKIFINSTEFIKALLNKIFIWYDTSTLNIIYKSKNHIYTGLYFKDEQKLYREYIIKNEDGKIKKILILVNSIEEVIKRIRDFTLLAATPNYETPNLYAFKNQMNKFANNTSVHYKIKRGD